ncbi:hypothetical protein C2G38_2030493 [Gigaspora rosea]|uniref:Uncharacterized protein n=1 Tax=Gigaspora rosea TaxID=44941 RepID=A0A397VWB0_9GLOM|nr:hypothetical protein C2G38_2030493 [Gigaspora rosea]
MTSLGYSSCAKTVDMYQKKVQKEYSAKIEHYFLKHNNFHVYNIDNYHSIHENRRPDTVSTSTANHFTTCVAKPIVGCSSVPLVFNGVSVHNPANVEASRHHLTSFNEYYVKNVHNVDLRHLPTAYSTAHPPRPELCDSCGRLLVNNNSTVFACGHGYHIDCYRGKCTHCEEFYKKGIFKNVRKFLTRIEKGEDKLTKKDIDDDENDVESQDEKSEDVKELDLSSKLIAEINQIENW